MVEKALAQWNQGFEGHEGHFIAGHGRIAARRSCRARAFDDGIRGLTEADEIPLAVHVGHDEGHRAGCGDVIERAEAQRGLLGATVVVILRDGLAGGFALQGDRRGGGEYLHRDTGEAFQVAVPLKAFNGHIGDLHDAGKGLG